MNNETVKPGLGSILFVAILLLITLWLLTDSTQKSYATNENDVPSKDILSKEPTIPIATNNDIVTKTDTNIPKDNIDVVTETDTSIKPDNPPENKILSWSGIYGKDNSKFKIYQSGSKILINGIGDDYLSLIGNTQSQTLKVNQYEFKLNDSGIEVSSSNESAFSSLLGTFNKENEYSKEDYYNDYVGDIEYINDQNWNGIYKLNDLEAKLNRISATEVKVIISGSLLNDLIFFSNTFTIDKDRIIYEDEFFNEKTSLTITKQNNELIIAGSAEDQNSSVNKLTGTYVYENQLLLDDIIG